MSHIAQLKNTLEKEFLPELDESLVEMANHVQSWKSTEEDKEEFEDLKEMKEYFSNVLNDIEKENLNEEDAKEILNVLEEMRL